MRSHRIFKIYLILISGETRKIWHSLEFWPLIKPEQIHKHIHWFFNVGKLHVGEPFSEKARAFLNEKGGWGHGVAQREKCPWGSPAEAPVLSPTWPPLFWAWSRAPSPFTQAPSHLSRCLTPKSALPPGTLYSHSLHPIWTQSTWSPWVPHTCFDCTVSWSRLVLVPLLYFILLFNLINWPNGWFILFF